jgi:hypothetical protein
VRESIGASGLARNRTQCLPASGVVGPGLAAWGTATPGSWQMHEGDLDRGAISPTAEADRGRCGSGRYRATMSGPFPRAEFDGIFSKVPRLTVEVLITSEERGVLLALRDVDLCRGMWNLPGGVPVRVGPLVGYIEYPSHYENGLDSPVGLVFRADQLGEAPPQGQWFTALPETMHEEQKQFLLEHAPVKPGGG